jgi:inner membrane transporter RhtA
VAVTRLTGAARGRPGQRRPVLPRAVAGVPAPLLVLVGIGSVQTGSAVARTVFDELGATGITLLRLVLAGLLLAALLRPKPWQWSRKALLAAGLYGVSMAGMNLSFYLAIRSVPLGVAVTVEFTGPLLVALVQTRRVRDAVWVGLAAAGVLLLGLGGGPDGRVALGGLAFAFLAGMFWGAYILASARVGQVLPGLDGLAVALLLAAVIALPFGGSGASRALEDPRLLAIGAAVALLSSIVPYGLELTALRRLPTRVFGVLMSLEPAAAALAGLVILGQRLAAHQLAALALVSLASAGVTLGRRQRTPLQPME